MTLLLRLPVLACLPVCVAAAALLSSSALADTVTEVVDLEPVWSAHPVGFCLLTHGKDQFAAYYDATRQMTVAHRTLGERTWTFRKLPRTTRWDSHNYITMAVDRTGNLHLAGDMHCAGLFYLRTTRPMDITSFEQVPNMVGPQRERRVTYPVFLRGPEGELIFRYRDGSSGSGDDLYNVYDPKTRRWSRLLDEPLTSGQGKRNAYCTRPARGPDGYFHVVWVWRDTPDAATNHHPSYARSRDLRHWETATGKPLKLPITLATGDVVDPVPPRGGIVNGNVRLGFDSKQRPVVTYHKYDAKGNTQIYAARLELGRWRVHQISNWDGYRWDFGGGGCIPFEVRVGSVQRAAAGTLSLSYQYKLGHGTWTLDDKTLTPIAKPPAPKPSPAKPSPRPAGPKPKAVPGGQDILRKVTSTFPGMLKRRAGDTGASGEAGAAYMLVWESLGPNRDRPRKPPLPEPVMLRLVKVVK